jgi:hypothetical protein
MRHCDPYTVPVRDMAAVDSLNAALTARQRAHLHRRLSRQLSGFEARIHALMASDAFGRARDFLRCARNSRRAWS